MGQQAMPGDTGSIKYSLREPFECAVESVCRSLRSRGLQIAGQLDVSRRVERALRIAMPPCRIVFVLPNPSAPSTVSIHPWAAIFLPLHVVISGRDGQAEIQVQNRVQAGHEAVPALFGPVMATQAQISEALDSIAIRPSILV
jgi:uncharacterized protein (DUF302 family)